MNNSLIEYLKLENIMLLKTFYKTIDLEYKKQLLNNIKENALYIKKLEHKNDSIRAYGK